MTSDYEKYMDEKYAKINAKLKQCQFCGGAAKLRKDPIGMLLIIMCEKCGFGTLCGLDEEMLVRKWNEMDGTKEEIES